MRPLVMVLLGLGSGILLFGCVSGTATTTPKPQAVAALSQRLLAENPLGQAIFAHPDVAGAGAEFIAAQSKVAEVAAGRRAQITASATAGVSSDIYEGRAPQTSAPVTLGVNASRVLADGGRLAARQAEAEADVAIAGAKLGLAADDVLARLAQGIITQDAATRTIAVIQAALQKYNLHADQFEAAAAAGVLTNAEVSQIRLAHNNIENRLLDAELAASQAEVDIAEALFAAVDPAAAQVIARKALSANLSAAPPAVPNFRVMAADLGVVRTRAAKQSAIVSTKPQTHMVAGLTAPATTAGGVTGFMGLRVDLTIADGGAAAWRAEGLEAAAQAGAQGAQSLRAQIKAQDSRSAQTAAIAAQQRKLLQQRLNLSRKRLAESEQLLLAGRTNVASLAQETLMMSETETALADLDQRAAQARLARFAVRGASCALFDLCKGLQLDGGVAR